MPLRHVRLGLEHLCYLMHAGLVVIYIALVVIASRHYEHSINTSFTSRKQTVMSDTVSVITQTFNTLYLTGLVWTIQRVTLRQDLHTRQTLTAIHDKSSAWLGLWSSASVLVDQLKVPSAMPKVMCIFLYLGGISVLHIAIPASLNINTYNGTVSTPYRTKLARPSSMTSLNPDILDILQFPIYDKLQHLGLLGLHDNTIYDVIPTHPMAISDPLVNATIFDVDCGMLPDAHQDPQKGFDMEFGWNIRPGRETSDPIYTNIGWTPFLTTTVWFDPQNPDPDPSYQNIFFITSRIPILDAFGNSSNSVAINPAIQFPSHDKRDTDSTGPNITVSSFKFFACNVLTKNAIIAVSGITGQPTATHHSIKASMRDNITWKNWTEDQSFDPLLQTIFNMTSSGSADRDNDHAMNQPVVLLSLFNTTGAPLEKGLRGSGTFESLFPTILDWFILDEFASTQPNSQPFTSIHLFDLQACLAKAFAAVVWYQRNLKNTQLDWALVPDEAQMGHVTLELAVTRLRLNFNIIALSVGLAVSCMLFILSFCLSGARRTKPGSEDLTSTGILQITWILGNDNRFEDIRKPENQTLRKAGMFEVEMAAIARERTNRSLHDYEIEVTELRKMYDIYPAVSKPC